MTTLSNEVLTDLKDFITANIASFIEDAIEYDGLDLTIACNDQGDKWTYQTGDNSFTGSCYSLPHWAVTAVFENTTASELIEDVTRQLEELICDIEEE
jgi:hypothetical protein